MLVNDCGYAVTLFFYEIVIIVRLVYFSWRYSRLEAKKHMPYLILNSLSLILALPLIIDDLIVFRQRYDEYNNLTRVYYEDFIAKILPSLCYILTKKNEDCFNNFNRIAPQTYSIL